MYEPQAILIGHFYFHYICIIRQKSGTLVASFVITFA